MAKNKKQQPNQTGRSSRIDLYKRSTYRRRNEKPENALTTTFRLIKYLRNELKLVLFVIFLMVFHTATTLGSSIVYRNVIDKYIENEDFIAGFDPLIAGALKGFVFTIVLLAFLYISSSIIDLCSGYIMVGVSQRTLKTMRVHIFQKMQQLSIPFFDQNRDGDLMSRITNDVDNISSTLTQSVIQFVGSILMLSSTLVLMFIMSWRLSLVTVVTVPFIYIAAKVVARFSRAKHRQMRYETGALNGFIAEQIDGAKVIQSFVQEKQIIDEFVIESEQLTATTIKATTISSLMGPTMEFLGNLRYIIIITAGAIMVTNGLTTVGTITTFVILANQFGHPLNQLANLYTDIQNALSGAERIFMILDDDTIIKDKPDAIELTDVQGRVELDHVSFAYTEDTYVLNDISIHASPGERIALVGHTGAGKTTIINLISRFYDIEHGEIKIDGVNIKDIKQQNLIEHIGIVLQDTHLFTTTVKENIRYGRLDATDEEIYQACKHANCHDFIMELPQGYDTLLTHNGANLSHGQRQLLSIARTLLKDPSILILDEATSSVDTMTERRITDAIKTITKGRTSFIIAHRLSTIRDCDLIVVMKDGKIIEQGKHNTLLDQEEVYYRLHHAKPNDTLLDDYEVIH